MAEFTRRDVLGTAALIGGWCVLGGDRALAQERPSVGQPVPGGPYTLPPLPYDYSDLEPHIDAQTMKLHHDVHHAGYVRNANAAVAELEAIRLVSAGLDGVPEGSPMVMMTVFSPLTLAFKLAGDREKRRICKSCADSPRPRTARWSANCWMRSRKPCSAGIGDA